MAQTKNSYMTSFTTHGLTKTCTGRPLERLFWLVCLSTALCFTVYMCNLFYTNYGKKDIRTEVRIIEKDEIPLPSITFCVPLWEKYACHNNKTLGGEEVCSDDASTLKVTCNNDDPNCNVTSVYRDCVTVNANGEMYSQYNFENISVEVQFDKIYGELFIFYDTPEELKSKKDVLIFAPHNKAPINGSYEVLLELQETSRLPPPYTSNCTNGDGIENFFSQKKYTRYSCLESCWMRYMYDRCGTVVDRWQINLPDDLKKESKADTNETEVCLYEALSFMGVPDDCRCPLPCSDVDFGATTIRMNDASFKGWQFIFRYKTHKVTYVTERVDYPFEKFLSEVGGLVSLLVGVSALSIIEIFVYVFISCAAILNRIKCRIGL